MLNAMFLFHCVCLSKQMCFCVFGSHAFPGLMFKENMKFRLQSNSHDNKLKIQFLMLYDCKETVKVIFFQILETIEIADHSK